MGVMSLTSMFVCESDCSIVARKWMDRFRCGFCHSKTSFFAVVLRHSAVDVTNGSGERRWDNESDRLSTYPATDRSCLLKSHAAKSAECGQQSPRARRVPRESRRVSLAQASGYVQLNQYRLLEPIGQGSYGIVKLAYNEEDDTHYAMKILSKRKLMRRAGLFGRTPPRRPSAPPPDPLQRVYREIAVLKKLDHPNVVKLVEVLDDPAEDQLYLVFQLLEGGPVIDIPTDAPLSEGVARKYFRDALLGVEYLHYQRIAHRDIKPANLLLGEDRVQVADLGACGELAGGGGRLSGAVGTPAFRAPEATAMSDDYCGEAADIWSLGITLFAMVTGRVPWVGATSLELQRKVITEPLTFPPRHQLSKLLRHLLSRMLDKEPSNRANMQEIKEHPWVTCSGLEPLPSEQENCRLVEVTEEDMARVVTSIPNLSTLILIKTMLKKHSFQNPFVRSREGSARRESVSARGECARAARTPLARAGRSLSAPGNYLTERQASFDVALESVDEIRDQSQDFSSKDISLDQLDSSVDTNDTTVIADTKTNVQSTESGEKTEETQKSQTSSHESKPTNLSNDSSQSIISDKSIDSDKTAKETDTFSSKYVNASIQTVNTDGSNSSSKSSSTQTVPFNNNSRHRSENSVVGAGRSSSSSCTVKSSSRSTGASNSGSSLTGADISGSNVTEGSSCSSDSAIGSSKR